MTNLIEREMAIQIITNLTQGNPGALTFLMESFEKFPSYTREIITGINNLKVKGSQLYMVWNDCCDRDTTQAVKVLYKCNNQHEADSFIKNSNLESGRGNRCYIENDEIKWRV